MSSSNNNKLPADAPEPRLCHLIKWPDFDGYGFNLHAEKSRTGQFIGKVDEGSPAQSAGLKEGDRIVEVNGVNIAQENHRQVVERIKSIANETQLLVVDPVADRWYKERKLVVKSTLPNVLSLKTPVQQPPAGEPPCYENIAPQNHATNGSAIENGVHEREPSPSPPPPKLPTKHDGKQKQNGTTHTNGTTSPVEIADVIEIKQEVKSNDSPIQNTKEKANDSRSSTPMDNNTSIADSPRSTKSSRSTNSAGASSNGPASLEDGILNLNMSASEMRQMLANRRKKDPKKEQMDIRQKYEIIQQM